MYLGSYISEVETHVNFLMCLRMSGNFLMWVQVRKHKALEVFIIIKENNDK